MSPETARLGEVASFIRGITFKPGDVAPRGVDGSVWCLRTKNVQAELDLSDVWAIDASFVKRSEQYLQAGDLLVSSANSWNLIGKCSWVPELESDATFGGFVTALRGNSQLVDRRYLYHWFSSSRTQAVVRSFSRQTTNIANLDLRRCAELAIPLPPLAQQKRIAAVLDAVDALRAKRREAIALLEDLAQSIFLDMFGDPARNPLGWPVGKVGDLLISANYGSSAKADMEGDIPVLRMNNVTASGEIDMRDLKYLPKEQVSEKYLVRAGDVLFNRTNSAELVGKAAIYRLAEEVAYAGYLVRLRVSEENNPEYLAAFLNSRYAKRVLRLMSKSIVGMANINAKEVQGMKILIPPLAEQKRFAAAITQVEAAKEPHRAHLATLGELFTSLQHRAFSGTLWDHEALGEAA
ncbi:restriction endonuclease subunit S [Streptomyces sp. NPDC008240]|uniref:restriction endonuclease subunit S n=1 Tax=Streptomyces sp. NPDC008240 TaxID=3364822 RepID=UPI0036E0E469